MLFRILTILLVLLVLLGASKLQAEVVKRVDLRRDTQAPGEYYVVICSRKSWPWGTGHSFVVWAEQTEAGLQTLGSGFYPGKDNVVLWLLSGLGRLSDEAERPASTEPALLTHRLIVRLDKQAYERSLAAREKWLAAQHEYNIFTCNCTHFSFQVAQAIGLQPPEPRTCERPPFYIERMMNACSEVPTRLPLPPDDPTRIAEPPQLRRLAAPHWR